MHRVELRQGRGGIPSRGKHRAFPGRRAPLMGKLLNLGLSLASIHYALATESLFSIQRPPSSRVPFVLCRRILFVGYFLLINKLNIISKVGGK